MSQAEEPFEERVGTVVRGQWYLDKLLGVGGMAAVYAARSVDGQREAAIKVLHKTVARSKEIRRRFEQEAHVMDRLEHPAAVNVEEMNTTDDGAPYIVMELLHGESLRQRIERTRKAPIEDVLRYADELLDVLAEAHDKGVVHRDIKLDNLFIVQDGSLKVLDFGIARIREGTPLTVVGTRLGTLPYMPPEQAKGSDVDGRADLFAVGATIFRLYTKRRVHNSKSEGELLIKMTSAAAPPLASVKPDAPAGLCLVVDRALAFDRDRRYPDARTMQTDIRAVREGREPPYAARIFAMEGPPNGPKKRAVPPKAPRQLTLSTRVDGPSARTDAPVVAPKSFAGARSLTADDAPTPTVQPRPVAPVVVNTGGGTLQMDRPPDVEDLLDPSQQSTLVMRRKPRAASQPPAETPHPPAPQRPSSRPPPPPRRASSAPPPPHRASAPPMPQRAHAPPTGMEGASATPPPVVAPIGQDGTRERATSNETLGGPPVDAMAAQGMSPTTPHAPGETPARQRNDPRMYTTINVKRARGRSRWVFVAVIAATAVVGVAIVAALWLL